MDNNTALVAVALVNALAAVALALIRYYDKRQSEKLADEIAKLREDYLGTSKDKTDCDP